MGIFIGLLVDGQLTGTKLTQILVQYRDTFIFDQNKHCSRIEQYQSIFFGIKNTKTVINAIVESFQETQMIYNFCLNRDLTTHGKTVTIASVFTKFTKYDNFVRLLMAKF